MYEGYNAKYTDPYKIGKKALEDCFEKMSDMKDTPGAIDEWEKFFEVEERRIALCAADGGPYYRGDAPPPLRPGVADADYATLPLPARVVFNADPLVYKPVGGSAGYSDSQRVAFAKAAAMHAQLKLNDNSLVALRLMHGVQCPGTHVVPFCLGIVPSGHRSVDVPQFSAFFSEATGGAGALAGRWDSGAQLAAPLSEVLCSGLYFEPLPDCIVPQDMSIADLKAELKSRGKAIGGPRPLLIERLLASVGETSAVPVNRGRKLTKASVKRLREVAGNYRLGL